MLGRALNCGLLAMLIAACSDSGSATQGATRRVTGGDPRPSVDSGSPAGGSAVGHGGNIALAGSPGTNAGGNASIGGGPGVMDTVDAGVPSLPVADASSPGSLCRNAPFYSFDQDDGNANDEFVHGFYTDAYGSPNAADFVYGADLLTFTDVDGNPLPGAIRAVIPFTREGEFLSITDGFFDPVVASYTFSAQIKLISNDTGCVIEAATFSADGQYVPTQGDAVLLVPGDWMSVQLDLEAVAITMLGLNIQVRGECSTPDGAVGSAVVLVDSIMTGVTTGICPEASAVVGSQF